jgi:hypothetical protein
MGWPYRDSIAWVLPDWSGQYYWYATTGGMVGTANVDSGEVHTMRLGGEIIENSFAVGEDGAYIRSDYAFTVLAKMAVELSLLTGVQLTIEGPGGNLAI